MKYFLVVFTVLISLNNSVFAQVKNSIIVGKIDSIYSNALKEQRKIMVYLPQSFAISSDAKYPVLYLLDGDIYFYSLSGIVKQLSSFGATGCPESIIIAIPNTNRNRDLTPYDPADNTYNLSGIEVFTDFIKNELIPFVDSKYPTLQHRTLIGHSLGGSFVISTLINHNDLFTNYLAIDPGLKFHNYRFFNQAIKKIEEKDYQGKSLFLTVANTMPEGMDTLTALKDTTWITATIRSNLNFATAIDGFTSNNLNYEWKYYPNESHISIPTISEYDGLRYFFSWNTLDLDKILRTTPDITGEDFYDKVNEHYKYISKKLAYIILPNQEQVNDLGYYFLQKDDFKGAYLFFSANKNNYAKSSASYDAMGDYYVAKGQKKKAAEFFMKAIEIDGNPDSKEKLEELKRKNSQ
jgi:predicted alpha/beta superfamily hydrolase